MSDIPPINPCPDESPSTRQAEASAQATPQHRLRALCEEATSAVRRQERASPNVHVEIHEILNLLQAEKVISPRSRGPFLMRAGLFLAAAIIVLELDSCRLGTARAHLEVAADHLTFRTASPAVVVPASLTQPLTGRRMPAREISVRNYHAVILPPYVNATLPRQGTHMEIAAGDAQTSITIEALQFSDKTDVALRYDRKGQLEIRLENAQGNSGALFLTLSGSASLASDGVVTALSQPRPVPMTLQLGGGASHLVVGFREPAGFTSFPIGVSRLSLGSTQELSEGAGASYYRELSEIRHGSLAFQGLSVPALALRPMEPLLLEAPVRSSSPGDERPALILSADPERGLSATWLGNVVKATRGPQAATEDLMPTFLDRFARTTQVALLWGATLAVLALGESLIRSWQGG